MCVKLISRISLKISVCLSPPRPRRYNLNCYSNGGQPGVNIISFSLLWRREVRIAHHGKDKETLGEERDEEGVSGIIVFPKIATLVFQHGSHLMASF